MICVKGVAMKTSPLTPVPSRRRARLRALGAIAASAGLFLVACSGDDDGTEEPTPSDELTPITLGANPITDLAPIWLAQSEGIFEEHGFDVTIETGAGGAALIPSLVAGDFEFTFVNATTLFVALESGLALDLVSGLASTTGEEGNDVGAILVAEDSDIDSPGQLEGHTVAVNTLNSIVSTVMRNSIREDGGDLEFVEIPFPEMPAQLEGGNVDAIMAVEPFLSGALASGARAIAWPYVEASPDLPIALTVTSDQIAQEDPEMVARFVEALDDATQFAQDNPDEARAIVTEYTELSDDAAAAVTLPMFSTVIDRPALERLAELSVQDGIIAELPDLDALVPAGD
jgi:NitT/TauT family transport system substrate-binding protein